VLLLLMCLLEHKQLNVEDWGELVSFRNQDGRWQALEELSSNTELMEGKQARGEALSIQEAFTVNAYKLLPYLRMAIMTSLKDFEKEREGKSHLTLTKRQVFNLWCMVRVPEQRQAMTSIL
jgi:hypothetical protein